MAPATLSDMIHWSHRLLAEVLRPGDLAIDLTAGRGHDTLWLAKQVQSDQHGCVVAFDIQAAALDSCRELLAQHHCRHRTTDPTRLKDSGINLIHGCHSQPWRLPCAPGRTGKLRLPAWRRPCHYHHPAHHLSGRAPSL